MATRAMTMATVSGMTMGVIGIDMIIAVVASVTRMTVGIPMGGEMVTVVETGGAGTGKGGVGSGR